ncbi:MAG: hypothetical protein JWP89_5434 [Schlesneria sp.]|nr:hypothetical protein [Schlesneria sp.]
MNPKRHTFLEFCVEITGYPSVVLEGTGVVDLNQQLLEDVLGSTLIAKFYLLIETVLALSDASEREKRIRETVLPSPLFGPVVTNLIRLWYLGYWRELPDDWRQMTSRPKPGPTDAGRTHVPSELSYIEQLSYRTARAHPPGAKPTGFGSWSRQPL